MIILAYVLGIFRSILGVVFLVLPDFALSAWLPHFSTDNEVAVVLAQHMGIRDLVLGMGLLYNLLLQNNPWLVWLLAALACDLTDVIISLLNPHIFAADGNATAYVAGSLLILLEGGVLYYARWKRD